MTNSCSAFGAYTKLIIEPDGGAFDANSERYAILGENITRNQPFQGRRRITGDRANYSTAIRPHTYLVSGAIAMQPGPADLANLLPRVLWGTGLALGDTAPVFKVLVDRENGIFHYPDCQMARMVLRSKTESGNEPTNEELVECIIYLMATSEDTNTVSWPDPEPTITLSDGNTPYNHTEGVLSLGGSSRPFKSFELVIDNMLTPVFNNDNDLGPSCLRSRGRRITLKTQNPFTTNTLADSLTALNSGIAGSLTFTNGGLSTSFTFPHLRNNYRSPAIQGRGEIPLTLNMEAFATSGSAEMVVTNDSTP